MAHGGARNRSGPSPDPRSLTSASKGFSLQALDAAGYRGVVPEFPLPPMRRMRWEYEGKSRFQVFDEDATVRYGEREQTIWAELWESPQAIAWSVERWRWTTIGEYCRLKAIVEQEPDAVAALVTQLHRYRDQIGMTPAGLKENGWAIAATVDDAAAKPKAHLVAVTDMFDDIEAEGA